ncbi:MAG: hypothetical protein ACTSUA_06745 [Candidatus Heimdallarchaeota archaeon]
MVLDNIAAIIIQPIIGNLSNRIWIRKLSRRMPFNNWDSFCCTLSWSYWNL